MICGLFFVYGFNIVGGNVFTEESFAGSTHARAPGRSGHQTATAVRECVFGPAAVGSRIGRSLAAVSQRPGGTARLDCRGRTTQSPRQAGQARRRGPADRAPSAPALFPVDIEIDNQSSEHYTVMHIRGHGHHRVFVRAVQRLEPCGNRCRPRHHQFGRGKRVRYAVCHRPGQAQNHR